MSSARPRGDGENVITAEVGLGVFGANAIGSKTSTKMAEGSLIVTMYAALRNLLPTSLSGSLGYYQPAATLTPDLPGQVNQAMRGSQAEESDRRIRFRPGKWIVASQVALSLVLLVTAGLFLRSFVKLITLDAGFDRNNVLIVNADLKTANIPPEQRPATYQDIETGLRSLPGVTSVGRSVMTPISNFEWNNFIRADSPNAPTGDDSLAFFNYVSPGYFATMRSQRWVHFVV